MSVLNEFDKLNEVINSISEAKNNGAKVDEIKALEDFALGLASIIDPNKLTEDNIEAYVEACQIDHYRFIDSKDDAEYCKNTTHRIEESEMFKRYIEEKQNKHSSNQK